MPKTTTIQIAVTSEDDVDPSDICGVLNQLIDVGLSDARDTVDDPNLDNPQAKLAVAIEIGEPTAV